MAGRLFFNISKETSNTIHDSLHDDSHKLSLETIEDYVNVLVQTSSVHDGASCLLKVIKNAEENQSQVDRIDYLNELYFKKFGLFGQIFKLLQAIEYDIANKSKYVMALELLYFIKLAFSKDTHAETIALLNRYNENIVTYYKNHPNHSNPHLFLGKTAILIFVDPTTMDIEVSGKPIDEFITQILKEDLANEVANNWRDDFIHQLDDIGFDSQKYNPNMLDEFKAMAEFQELVQERRSLAESNAKSMKECMDKHLSQDQTALKL